MNGHDYMACPPLLMHTNSYCQRYFNLIRGKNNIFICSLGDTLISIFYSQTKIQGVIINFFVKIQHSLKSQ